MEFVTELMKYMKRRRKLWMLPVFTMLLAFGGLILLTQGSVIAPFIYTIF
jgi:Family of unknown function (DUF5989)